MTKRSSRVSAWSQKNHLNIDSQMSETNVKEGIEKCVINRNVKIQFIKKGENNIATMVEIN